MLARLPSEETERYHGVVLACRPGGTGPRGARQYVPILLHTPAMANSSLFSGIAAAFSNFVPLFVQCSSLLDPRAINAILLLRPHHLQMPQHRKVRVHESVHTVLHARVLLTRQSSARDRSPNALLEAGLCEFVNGCTRC